MVDRENTEPVGFLDEEQVTDFIFRAGQLEHPREMTIDILRAIQKSYQ